MDALQAGEQRAQARLRFLSEASEVLAGSLDYQAILDNLVSLIVPALADWCMVERLDEQGRIELAALNQRDPDKVSWARELYERYPRKLDAPSGVAKVLRTGKSELIGEVPEAMLDAATHDDAQLDVVRSMRIQSVMIVPLAARERTLGALTFISAESGRRYEADDLEVANILGRRAALALDNARMYELEQQARAQSEEAQRRAELLAEVTTQLSASLDYPTTLSNVSRLVVPTYADFCIVLLSDGQHLRQVAAAHRDAQQQRLLDELPKHYETTLTNPLSLASTVWRTGEAMLLRELPDNARAEVARSGDAARIVAALGAQSSIIVPLNTSVCTLGVITFSYAESGRQYREADMPFAKELAACAALAIEHARLFKGAQTLNAELEQRVVERTAQLQRANEDLRNLAAHLQVSREQERANLARELHDELGQILTVIKIEASQLGKRVAQVLEALNYPPEQLLEPLHLIQANVDEGVRAVRQIITQMRPEFLEDLGLKAAIEWQLQQFQSRTGIETQFSSNVEQLAWDQERATAMFRILQESLTNVARHAEATRVDVSLRREPEYLLLEVRDNGRGISNTEMHKSSHFGIMGMRERAILLGGEIQIAGAQGGGTSLLVRVPH